jgi:hypothetical protein
VRARERKRVSEDVVQDFWRSLPTQHLQRQSIRLFLQIKDIEIPFVSLVKACSQSVQLCGPLSFFVGGFFFRSNII